MKKLKFLLIISAVLTIIGIGLTIYEFQVINENVANKQQNLTAGESMILTKSLNKEKNQDGVYLIQVTDFNENDKLTLTVFNPTDTIIISKSITINPIQENFLINLSGNYTIQIENKGTNEVQALVAIGSNPKNVSSLDIIGFILLLIGLVGVVLGLIYFLRIRGKTSVS